MCISEVLYKIVRIILYLCTMKRQNIYIVVDSEGGAEAYTNMTKAAYNMIKASYHTLYRLMQQANKVHYKGYTVHRVILK